MNFMKDMTIEELKHHISVCDDFGSPNTCVERCKEEIADRLKRNVSGK